MTDHTTHQDSRTAAQSRAERLAEAAEAYRVLFGVRACSDCGRDYTPGIETLETADDVVSLCAGCLAATPACTICGRAVCYERARAAYGSRLDWPDAAIVAALVTESRAVAAAEARGALFVDVGQLLALEALWRYVYSHGSDTHGYRDLACC